MAKFRQGDLVLQSTQRIIQGGLEILDEYGALEVSSLSFSVGATITQFDTDITLAADSDTRVPTQSAIKTYVDAQVGGTVPPGIDESILRYNGTNTVHDSLVFIDDIGNVTGINNIDIDGTASVATDLFVTDIEASGSGTFASDVVCDELYLEGTDFNFINSSDEILTSINNTGQSLFLDVGMQSTGESISLRGWNGSSLDNMLVATQGASVQLFYNGNTTLTTTSAGIIVHDVSGDDPQIQFYSDSPSEVGKVWISNGHMYLDSGIGSTGKTVYIRGYNGSGYDELIQATQGGGVLLHHNDSLTLATMSAGIRVYDASGDDPQIRFHDDSLAEVSRFSVTDGTIFIDSGRATSGGESVVLRSWNGSAYENLIQGTQGSSVDFYYDGVLVGQTNSNGISGATWG